MNKTILLMAIMLCMSVQVMAYVDTGSYLECNSCSDCVSAINSNIRNEIHLVQNITAEVGTYDCICSAGPLIIDNKVFDCLGNSITGLNSGNGFCLYNNIGVTIRNCTIANFSYGIYMQGVNNTNMFRNKFKNNSHSIYIDNDISSDSFYNNYFGYYITAHITHATGSGALILNTTLQSGQNILGGPYIGGNFWYGFSETCNDANKDGICDSSYTISGIGTDYLPLSSVQPLSTIINVCPSGCPYSSIQAAINAANNGDTINVSADTYYENIIVNKSVNLRGQNANTIINASNPTQAAVRIYNNYVNMTGFKVVNVTGGQSIYYDAIYVNGSYVNISGNIIDDAYEGLFVVSSSNSIFSNNTIKNVNDTAIYLENSYNNVIADNIVIENYYTAVYLYQSNNTNVSNNNIISNGGAGIRIEYTNNTFVINNSVKNNAYDGFKLYYAYNNFIENNTIANNGYSGIIVSDSNNNTFIGNKIYSNLNDMSLGISSGNKFVKNILGLNFPTKFDIENYDGSVTISEINTTYNVNKAVYFNKTINIIQNTKWINFSIYYDDTNFENNYYENSYRIYRNANNWTYAISYLDKVNRKINVNTTYTGEYGILFFDEILPHIWEELDTFYPYSFQRSIIYPGMQYVYWFNATINDTTNLAEGKLKTVYIEFNGMNYTPSVNGQVYSWTITGLQPGTYPYKWYAIDEFDNVNVSNNYTLTIYSQSGGGGGGVVYINKTIESVIVCGNGICEKGEETTCPQDCMPTKIEEVPTFGKVQMLIALVVVVAVVIMYFTSQKEKKRRQKIFSERKISRI